MNSFTNPNELLIGDHTPVEHVDLNTGMKGLVPRDYGKHPVGAFAPPTQVKLIPRSEWRERIAAMTANKSRLSDVRNVGNYGQRIPSLDQNDPRYMNTNKPRWGYCWFHSVTGAVILNRAVMNQPYVALSAFGGAYTMKNGRDEGAWGALALDFIKEHGVPPESMWPRFEQRMRSPDDQCWTEAKKYRITDGWEELQAAVYDRNMTFDQVMTMLMMRIPVVTDFNWWGHSVLSIDPVDGNAVKDVQRNDASGKLATPQEIEAMLGVGSMTDGYCVRIWNSWGDEWSDAGTGVLSGSKAVPDGAVAPSNVLAA